MSHLDEGTLHALLDGELDAKEMREIQAHLGSCSACGTRLQSVKEIAAESDRLVGVIQFPGTPRRPAALDPSPESVRETPPEIVARAPAESVLTAKPEFEEPPAYEPPEAFEPAPPPRSPRPPDRRIGGEPIYDQSPPVLLVPNDSQWGERRRRVLVFSRWAALVAVAVGAGYIANEVRRTNALPVPAASREAPVDDSSPVLSSAEEVTRPDSIVTPARQAAPAGEAAVAPATPPPAAKPAPKPAPTVPPAAKAAEKRAADRADQTETVSAAGFSQADTQPAQDQAAAGEEPPPSANVREEAADALAELDHERRRERAAAATAALDNEARRRAQVAARAAAPAEVAPPAPRTLEQRSNIYLRIGLDEAARQLGRPVHVIEGMQQQFMGLAQGVASPSADATRPVVRVVYQDNQGRMILLDQQRIRPGQTWGAGDTRWIVGEIGLALLGEPGPEILKNLRPRVR